jgi:hypothetical protein
LSRVVLPDPFSPIRAYVFPSGTSSDTSRNAQNSSYFTRARRMIAAFSDWLRS